MLCYAVLCLLLFCFCLLVSSRFLGLFQEAEGEVCFIDRDGSHFHHILNYLRDRFLPSDLPLCVLSALDREAQYYGMEALHREIKQRQQQELHKQYQIQLNQQNIHTPTVTQHMLTHRSYSSPISMNMNSASAMSVSAASVPSVVPVVAPMPAAALAFEPRRVVPFEFNTNADF